MTIMLLSIWSCVILFAILVNRKFRWTRPSFSALLLYFGFGLLSPFAAAFFSSWLMRETPLHVDSPDIWNSMLAYFIAAGMGEELFKMGACLLATMVLILAMSTIRPSIVVLGCVCVALAFASLENILYFIQGVDGFGMLKRSYLAVPLHACMGFIHGICIDRSLRSGSVFPLIIGYVVTVFFHTLYDIMGSILSLFLGLVGMGEEIPHLNIPVELIYGPIVFPLMVWMILRWRRVAELDTTITNVGDYDR